MQRRDPGIGKCSRNALAESLLTIIQCKGLLSTGVGRKVLLPNGGDNSRAIFVALAIV